jgi:hypothetical protein
MLTAKISKFLLLDAIGDLSFDQSFNQLSSGEDHQYVIDFNNAFMLIGLVSIPFCQEERTRTNTSSQQNTFAWVLPFIPYTPFKFLKDAYFGLQRVFSYSQSQVNKYLALDVSKKQDTLMSGFLDSKTGQPKEDYDSWSIALSGHGFM